MGDRTHRIREFIDEPRRQQLLFRNLVGWHRLCSALDVIGDTDLALEAYRTSVGGDTEGDRYLAVYGVLQALFIQQDAVFGVAGSLSVPVLLENYPRLNEIRTVRNASIGHPTKKTEKQGRTSYHFIVRISLSRNGFELLSIHSDDRYEAKFVSIPDLIADQSRLVDDILGAIIAHLENEEESHKQRFRTEKLADIFRSLSYVCEKVFAVIEKSEHAVLPEIAVGSLRRMLDDFRSSLERRGVQLNTYDSVKHLYDELEHPMAELARYFEPDETTGHSIVPPKTARIFAEFICGRIGTLHKIAEEIDEYYAG